MAYDYIALEADIISSSFRLLTNQIPIRAIVLDCH